MKVILDSNVIVAAFATRGLCASVLELCIDRCEIIMCNFILKEVSEILFRKFKVPQNTVSAISNYLSQVSQLIKYERIQGKICRDTDDDEILSLAKDSKADFIITGDQDLLIIQEWKESKIITPRQFWELMKQEMKNT